MVRTGIYETDNDMTGSRAIEKITAGQHGLIPAVPVNEFYYRNCGYHALITAISHYGRRVQLFISNSVAVFREPSPAATELFSCSYVSQKSDQALFSLLGIQKKDICFSTQICTDIIDSLSAGRLAIVHIDSFFVQSKTAFYNKQHQGHSLLVCGYDYPTRTFQIIDNAVHLGSAYKKDSISFEELETAYYAYNNRFNPQHADFSFFIVAEEPGFDSTQAPAADFVKEDALENLRTCFPLLQNGVQALANARKKIIGSPEEQQQWLARSLKDEIAHLIIARKLEHYKFSEIIGDAHTAELLARQADLFTQLRNSIVKMEVSGTGNIRLISTLPERLERIAALEASFVSKLEILV